jgi:hypothetical protein
VFAPQARWQRPRVWMRESVVSAPRLSEAQLDVLMVDFNIVSGEHIIAGNRRTLEALKRMGYVDGPIRPPVEGERRCTAFLTMQGHARRLVERERKP